jgi:predicted ATPase
MSKVRKTGTQRGVNGRPGKATPPPAYFLSLEVENVRCFGPRQELDLSNGNGRPAQWTVILGDNGTGKTTLLQCLAALEPCAFPNPDVFRDNVIPKVFIDSAFYDAWRPARSGKAEVPFLFLANVTYGSKLNGTPTRRTPSRATATRSTQLFYVGPRSSGRRSLAKYAQVGGLACYGYSAARRMGETSLAEKSLPDSTASLFNNGTALLNAEEWLLQADYAATKPSPVQTLAAKRRDDVKSVLTDILPDIYDIEFTQPSEEHPAPGVRVKTPYGWVSVRDLSLGYKTLIAWMVDFASRMFDRYPHSPNPIAEPAIVLIDEIDLHLHPKWQRDLIRFLSERFVNTQFIVTAHSPLVVQAAQNANVALLRREGDHVVIDNDVERIKGWRVDQVLTSDLFGLQSARPPELDELLAKRKELLSKGRLTRKDRATLSDVENKIGPLPAGETPEQIRSIDIINRAAKLIQQKANKVQKA